MLFRVSVARQWHLRHVKEAKIRTVWYMLAASLHLHLAMDSPEFGGRISYTSLNTVFTRLWHFGAKIYTIGIVVMTKNLETSLLSVRCTKSFNNVKVWIVQSKKCITRCYEVCSFAFSHTTNESERELCRFSHLKSRLHVFACEQVLSLHWPKQNKSGKTYHCFSNIPPLLVVRRSNWQTKPNVYNAHVIMRNFFPKLGRSAWAKDSTRNDILIRSCWFRYDEFLPKGFLSWWYLI